MTSSIRILLADDHELILEGVAQLLERQQFITVVKKASDGQEVISYLSREDAEPVDIAILDINMPKKNGLECMEYIHKHKPMLKVMLLTIYQQEFVIRRMIELGAKAFLPKNISYERLVRAIDTVHSGREDFEDVEEIIQRNSYEDTNFKLSNREKEIIQLIVDGKPSRYISEQLDLSEWTINTHRKNIMKKLNFSTSAQLAAFAKTSGILD